MSQETEELTLDDAYAEDSAEVAEVITKTIETDEVKESEPEVVEEPVKTEPEAKPEESTTDSKLPEGLDDPRWDRDSWMFSQAMDERGKVHSLRTENAQFRKELDALKKPEEDEVSVLENEELWQKNQDQKSANELLGVTRAFAVDKFGEETVVKAEKWYANEGIKSPYVSNLVDTAKLKFHQAVYSMQEDEARQDPETFKAKYEAEVLEKFKAEGWTRPQETETEPPSITPSLASKRSAGSDITAAEDWEDILGE